MFRYSPTHAAQLEAAPLELAGMAWRFRTGGQIRSTPAVAQGLAIVGSNDGSVYAVELKSGKERWKVVLGGDVSSSPAIAGEQVIVMAPDGRLLALRLADGSTSWSLATGPDISFGEDGRACDLWVSSPTIAGDLIYVGGGDGKVHAVELATGVERWAFATRHRVRATPAVADGVVYVGSFDGHMYALDARTGALKWKFQSGDSLQSSAAVADGLVFFGGRSLAVFALDAKTGAQQWRRPHSGSWIVSSPALADGKVIIGGSDSHVLEALEAKTGEPVWSLNVGARVIGSPTVAGKTVLYGSEDWRVYTVDLDTGLGRSIDLTEGAVYSSIVLSGDLALVGSDDRHLYAYHTRPAKPAATTASAELLAAMAGRYRTPGGDVFTLVPHLGRLRTEYCTYPPAETTVREDGTFDCAMLWGTTGRVQREPGKPVSALQLNLFGTETVATRID